MTIEELKNAVNQIIYLAGCVINDTVPDKDKIENINSELLYEVSRKHSMDAIVGYALEMADIYDDNFIQAKAKSIRKVTVMEIDKEILLNEMEKEKIWYMPLKGIVIKELYPSIGLRQMSDFDILFDKNYAENVRDILTGLGFTCGESFGKYNHDVYFKKPVSNFEMHYNLFEEHKIDVFYEYYKDIRSRLLKDEGNEYGFHFSDEDFYIYQIAHEYKHYVTFGTGIRSLMDIYVYWKKHGSHLDMDYIQSETEKLGIKDFEQKNRSLALHLFENEEITDEEKKMLEYIILCGTYGTVHNQMKHYVDEHGGGKKGKRAYVLEKIFLPMYRVRDFHPFYYKHKILLPVLPFYRIGRALTVNRKSTKKILKILKDIK